MKCYAQTLIFENMLCKTVKNVQEQIKESQAK
jgi:hypothetical protein